MRGERRRENREGKEGLRTTKSVPRAFCWVEECFSTDFNLPTISILLINLLMICNQFTDNELVFFDMIKHCFTD